MAIGGLNEIAVMRIHVIHFCMTQSEPGWELFRTFLEVARDGSLSGAARKLALTQPTVGRHIDALEAALGLSLFSRSPKGLTATPAALELVGHAEAMAAASAALRRTASSGTLTDRGTVRVAASEMIGCEVLPTDSRQLSREPSRHCSGTGGQQPKRRPVAAGCGHRRPHGSSTAEVAACAPHRQDRDRFLCAPGLFERDMAFRKRSPISTATR